MRVSLRNLLIALPATGAAIGIMARLRNSDPEVFVAVLSRAGSILPFGLTILMILWLAWRGASPKNGRLVVAAALIVTWTVVLNVISSKIRNPYSVTGKSALIGEKFTSQLNAPQIWQELQRRLAAGELTSADVDAIIESAVESISNSVALKQSATLSFYGVEKFFEAAYQSGNMSPPGIQSLFDAINGEPTITQFQNRGYFPGFQVTFGQLWSRALLPLWTVRQIRVDGEVVQPKSISGTLDRCFFRTNSYLVADRKHVVEATIEVLYPNSVQGKTGLLCAEDFAKAISSVAGTKSERVVRLTVEADAKESP